MSKLNDVSDGCIEVNTAMKNLPLNDTKCLSKTKLAIFSKEKAKELWLVTIASFRIINNTTLGDQ